MVAAQRIIPFAPRSSGASPEGFAQPGSLVAPAKTGPISLGSGATSEPETASMWPTVLPKIGLRDYWLMTWPPLVMFTWLPMRRP